MSWLWLTCLAMLVAAVINKVVDDARLELAQGGDSASMQETPAFSRQVAPNQLPCPFRPAHRPA